MLKEILIVDDELEMCISLQKLFKAHAIDADYCIDTDHARIRLEKNHYRILLTDLRMPKVTGIDLLKVVQNLPHVPKVILISGYASTDAVVEAMRCGAVNFYEKPVPFKDLLTEVSFILKRGQEDTKQPIRGYAHDIVTANPKMKKIIAMAEKAAMTDAPVIITGESGTGKELISSIIHTSSDRKGHPFIKLNCAALPESLLESELFGYEKGAFTDAKERRAGKFEAADKGTIFFDEIGDMSLKTQAKLLRVLQEHEYQRIGSNKTLKTNSRFVAATNRDLSKCIEEGRFREDLFFRLSVICFEIPPLRERLEDIPLLTDTFIRHFNQKYHKEVRAISDQVLHTFINHSWPGNIRELKNCIERALIFCEGNIIEVEQLPSQYQMHIIEEDCTPMKDLFNSISREMILNALSKVNGNRTKAAELLNISRKTLYLKMKKLDIEY